MDRFQDGHYVRLRSRVHRTYLHADADGETVTLSQPRASMNAAWRVHIYNVQGGDVDGDGSGNGDGPYLLLHSAANGRYLATTDMPARPGLIGLRAELRDYDQPEVEAIRWEAVGSGFADDVVLLRHVDGRYLRANGRYLHWNSTGISVDDSVSSMMHWIVETIPFREAGMPAIPGPLPNGPRFSSIFSSVGRRIRFVRALEDGDYPPEVNSWRQFWFRGRSAFSLRGNLAAHVVVDDQNIAMCVRAGRHGRLTPLVVNLPDGGYGGTLEIVVFVIGTPGYNALQYPDVDAQ
ncbi:uncharacterized protein LOC123429351 [Hordeum vulgare subsp. vulgare]|uniref:uncharacterized protein LOC123429351 n=1 Tax=Hordeum vulgare subsp. vulgare TaxID=112509 RepID=UPI001D1A468C|nr:uncharacterized protein LOC123429351 [Hordeum vulgare subsp. vulgare]